MKDDSFRYLMLVRVLLIAAGVAWGVSLFGLVLPWGFVEKELASLGAGDVSDVMVKYWLKMAAAVYTFMGGFFVFVAARPEKFRAVISPIGWLHIFLGTVFLINGLLLGVEWIPLYADVGFCWLVGIGIVVGNRKMTKKSS